MVRPDKDRDRRRLGEGHYPQVRHAFAGPLRRPPYHARSQRVGASKGIDTNLPLDIFSTDGSPVDAGNVGHAHSHWYLLVQSRRPSATVRPYPLRRQPGRASVVIDAEGGISHCNPGIPPFRYLAQGTTFRVVHKPIKVAVERQVSGHAARVICCRPRMPQHTQHGKDREQA